MKSDFFSSLLLAPVLLVGCSHTDGTAAATAPVLKAQLVHSTAAQAPQSITFTGSLHARESAAISAQVPGQVRQVLVQPGDRVRAGEVLVVLDGAAMHSALTQATEAAAAAQMQQQAAQADASLAAETLARYRILKEQNSVSPQEFDEVENRSHAAQLRLQSLAAQSRAAQAAVATAHTQFDYATLRAPFSGVVTARLADPGTLATPGTPLLQVDRDGPLQVWTPVDESLIATVRPGMKVPIAVDGFESGGLTGTVAQIVPSADPASRSFLVKLDLLQTKHLYAGMYATVHFPGSTHSVIVAPQSAIVMRGSLACVYALDSQGIAQLRYVTVGTRHGDQVEFLSGLAAGETLVNLSGDHDLAGKRIESSNEAQP